MSCTKAATYLKESCVSAAKVTLTNQLTVHSKGKQSSGRTTGQCRGRKLLEGKASVLGSGLRTGCWVVDGAVRWRRRTCSDDLWIEEQKKYKHKLARAIRGSMGQLNTLLSENRDKVRCGLHRLFLSSASPLSFCCSSTFCSSLVASDSVSQLTSPCPLFTSVFCMAFCSFASSTHCTLFHACFLLILLFKIYLECLQMC